MPHTASLKQIQGYLILEYFSCRREDLAPFRGNEQSRSGRASNCNSRRAVEGRVRISSLLRCAEGKRHSRVSRVERAISERHPSEPAKRPRLGTLFTRGSIKDNAAFSAILSCNSLAPCIRQRVLPTALAISLSNAFPLFSFRPPLYARRRSTMHHLEHVACARMLRTSQSC